MSAMHFRLHYSRRYNMWHSITPASPVITAVIARALAELPFLLYTVPLTLTVQFRPLTPYSLFQHYIWLTQTPY
jgi:hypothetical protein